MNIIRILSLSLLLLMVDFANGTAKVVKNSAILNFAINIRNSIDAINERFANYKEKKEAAQQNLPQHHLKK